MTKLAKWRSNFQPEQSKWWDTFIFILLTLIWGSSFKLMKEGLLCFSSTQVACMRISIAGIAFLPVLLINITRIPWSRMRYFAGIGFLGSFLPAFCFTTAQQHLSSSAAGILNSLTPLFTVIVGILFYKDIYPRYKIAGVILGLLGAMIMILYGKGTDSSTLHWSPWGLLLVLATFFYGINSNLIKHHMQDISAPVINAIALFIIMIPSLVILFSTDFVAKMQHHPMAQHSFTAVALLGVLGTALSGYLYFGLIKRRGVLYGVMVTYLMPIVALAWGLYDHENITPASILALVIILFSIYIVNADFSAIHKDHKLLKWFRVKTKQDIS